MRCRMGVMLLAGLTAPLDFTSGAHLAFFRAIDSACPLFYLLTAPCHRGLCLAAPYPYAAITAPGPLRQYAFSPARGRDGHFKATAQSDRLRTAAARPCPRGVCRNRHHLTGLSGLRLSPSTIDY
ncbi:hypothetical protein ACFOGG_05020 [Brenneria rubrifaciens]|uniref:hypothetical protein n=1 Tax=Brenneria rubrifaciens TaxID=55213 RepID=UPI003610F8E0